MHEGHFHEEFAATAPIMERPALLIRRIEAIPVTLPLVKPMTREGATVDQSETLLLRLDATDGSVGWGEAKLDCSPAEAAALRDELTGLLMGQDAWRRPALMARLFGALTGRTNLLAALDMALLDLAGQMSGLPLIDLIGGAMRDGAGPTGAATGREIGKVEDVEAAPGALSLRLGDIGGIGAALEAAQRARRRGLAVGVAAISGETSLANAAALHLACAVPTLEGGLRLTQTDLAHDIVRLALPGGSQAIAQPLGPGLGVEIDDSAVDHFRRR